MHVLGIETSCDDTCVALVSDAREVIFHHVVNQDSLHERFGGIVPEIASRNHTLFLLQTLDEKLKTYELTEDCIDAIAVTNRPGLMGSLLVGTTTAQALCICWGKPLFGVHHLEGHLAAPFLGKEEKKFLPEEEPHLSLVVSGGHTLLVWVPRWGKYEVLGRSLDDAAGEALDKIAQILGLGFPGGRQIDEMAQGGDSSAYSMPEPLKGQKDFQFSFSGLKTFAKGLYENLSKKRKLKDGWKKDFCASYQKAVVQALLEPLYRAQEKLQCKNVVITGGVSANSFLRSSVERWGQEKGVCLLVPEKRFCTDNAAMVALAGIWDSQRKKSIPPEEAILVSARSLKSDSWSGDKKEI